MYEATASALISVISWLAFDYAFPVIKFYYGSQYRAENGNVLNACAIGRPTIIIAMLQNSFKHPWFWKSQVAVSTISVFREDATAFLNVIPVSCNCQRRIITSNPQAEMLDFRKIGRIQSQEVGYMTISWLPRIGFPFDDWSLVWGKLIFFSSHPLLLSYFLPDSIVRFLHIHCQLGKNSTYYCQRRNLISDILAPINICMKPAFD